MKNTSVSVAGLMLLMVIAYSAYATTCPYDSDYKFVLKKALTDYYSNPQDSKLSPSELSSLLNFYLSSETITNGDCDQGGIGELLNKADMSVPDSTLLSINAITSSKCDACPDGAVCGEENDHGQTCTCKDVDSDGRPEYCYLKPIMPPKPHCLICPDGTLCGEQNYKDEICLCTDVNNDQEYEYCRLKPVNEPTTTSTTIPKPCANEGEKVYSDSALGPTYCCSKNDGIKPSTFLEGDKCITPKDGSTGTCIAGWWQTCPDGKCGTGEDKCNCPKDCPERCAPGETKNYTCQDQKQVPWCICTKDYLWSCINTPETQCNPNKKCSTDIDCADDSTTCHVCVNQDWLRQNPDWTKTHQCDGIGTSICKCIDNVCTSMTICGDGKCDQTYENLKNCPKDCTTASCPSVGLKTTYAELSKQHPGCTAGSPVGGPCNAAINRYCQTKGYVSGYGPVEYYMNDVNIVCVSSSDSAAITTSFTELGKQHNSCTSGSPVGGPCNAAINRYCRTKGYVSGYGPVEYLKDAAVIVCTDVQASKLLGTTFTELSKQHAGCVAGSPVSGPCNAAINRYCKTKGYESGYGPVEYAQDTAYVVCTESCSIPPTTSSTSTSVTTTTTGPTTTKPATTTTTTGSSTTSSATTTTQQPTTTRPTTTTASTTTTTSTAPGPQVCSALLTLRGTTNDASDAMQACIDAASPGSIVEFPAGKYYISKTVSITKAITLRTQGKTSSMAMCSYDGSSDCAEIIGSTSHLSQSGLLWVSGSGMVLDHLVVDGNKAARASSTAGSNCRGGNNAYGQNIRMPCSNCAFTNSVSKDALCGTGLEVTGKTFNVVVKNSAFVYNGVHNQNAMWSDGLTVHDSDGGVFTGNVFIDNTDVDNVFGGCENCRIQNNQYTHTGSVSGGSFAALMLHAWPGGSGNYTGTDTSNNQIDCSGSHRCGYGLYLGADSWYITNSFGGSVHDNTVTGAQLGVNLDDVHDMQVYNNRAKNWAATCHTSRGDYPSFAYNMGTRTTRIDTSKDTIGTKYAHTSWDGRVPNWWR